jgi:hypothetical protein
MSKEAEQKIEKIKALLQCIESEIVSCRKILRGEKT